MKATRLMAIATGVALLTTGLFAAPSVEITSVQQQYPWTNTVDIVYNVAGVVGDEGYFVKFTPLTSDNKAISDVNGQNDVQVALTNSGTYTAQWYPQTNQQYTACKMVPSVWRGGANEYMIVDLETGEVTYEPMATQEESNQKYQADIYKTKYLVLRRIEGGKDYWIGGPEDGKTSLGVGPNSYHKVNIPEDYYFAIYELTVAQYDQAMGLSNPSTSVYPQRYKSWNDVRGAALSQAIPTKGLFAELNKKTNLKGFDLPTESMWEVAARAGCTTKWLTGDTSDGMTDYGWFKNNGNSVHEVGLKKPNAWGIYDLFGNLWEYVRDTYNTGDLATLQPNGFVPITSGTAANTMFMGNSFEYDVSNTYSRFAARAPNTKAAAAHSFGIRVSYFPQ